MTRSLSRRRLLAAAVPGLLAGCLVESDEGGSENGVSSEDGEAVRSDPENDGSTESDAEADIDDSTAEETRDEPVPDTVGPDGAGLVVTDAEVRSVTRGAYETTVDVRLTVENRGRFTYGTVEFRVDAYATRLRDYKPVGYAYVRRHFGSNRRFDDGERQFEVEIAVSNDETHTRPDPDWYEVGAAVRTADPV